jgi:hypothetical protein
MSPLVTLIILEKMLRRRNLFCLLEEKFDIILTHDSNDALSFRMKPL